MIKRTQHSPLKVLLIFPVLMVALSADAAENDVAQRTCLAHTLYWEAKNEGREGMIAVGWVVLNRRNHEEFPPPFAGSDHARRPTQRRATSSPSFPP